MKTVLSLIALFSVSLAASAALIESLGFSVPALISLESGLSLFVGAFAILIFSATYSSPRTAEGPRQPRVARVLNAPHAIAACRNYSAARRSIPAAAACC